MKGATAEPLDKNNKSAKYNHHNKDWNQSKTFYEPSKITVQISLKNDMLTRSKLIFKRTSFQAMERVAMNPAAFSHLVQILDLRTFSNQSHDEPNRRNS